MPGPIVHQTYAGVSGATAVALHIAAGSAQPTRHAFVLLGRCDLHPSHVMRLDDMQCPRAYVRKQSRWDLGCYRRAGRAMADLDPVAAIFHGVRTWPTMRQFQRLRPEVPRVLMVHTAPRLLDRWRWRKVAAATMRSAHAVVAVSHVQQRWLETTAPMDRHAGKLTCIPSGVDVDFWRHEPALIPRDRPRLAMVGSLVAEKGQDALIRAVGLLRGAGRSVELTLVGDGPSRVDLERLAGKLGIARRVRFSGQADPETVRDILHETDIYVHASPAEGRSIAVMEALCAGRAVVAVDSPGMAELVTPGKTGWLIPSASPQPIADVVAGVLDRPDDALRVAREGFREATEHFNRTRMAERFESLLGLLTGETG